MAGQTDGDNDDLSLIMLVTGLRGSLSRLQLDYVDIVFANRNDVNSPMEGQLFRCLFTYHEPVIALISCVYVHNVFMSAKKKVALKFFKKVLSDNAVIHCDLQRL